MAGNPIANLLGKVNASNALVVSLDGGAIAGSLVTVSQTALGTTPAPGVIVQNTTSAAAGAQQISPATDWVGQGWKTDATAGSQEVRFRADVLPVQGTANPTGTWRLGVLINSGAVAYPLQVTSAGSLLTQDGTLANPAFASVNDVNMGIYFPSTNAMAITNASVGIMHFGSNLAQMGSGGTLAWCSTADASGSAADTILSRGAANRLDLATGDSLYVISGGIGVATAPTATSWITTGAGTTAIAPLTITNGSNLTAAAANTIENDGAAFYSTIDTTNGRRYEDSWNYFRLTGSGTGITSIADFFGSNDGIPLVANGVYEIEWHCYFSQVTAGTATWTIVTATTALATLTGEYNGSNIAGIGTVGAPQTAAINATASSSTAFPVSGTEATGVTHYFTIRALLTAGNGASNTRLRLTMSAGTATPLINSYFRVRRLSGANVGTYVA